MEELEVAVDLARDERLAARREADEDQDDLVRGRRVFILVVACASGFTQNCTRRTLFLDARRGASWFLDARRGIFVVIPRRHAPTSSRTGLSRGLEAPGGICGTGLSTSDVLDSWRLSCDMVLDFRMLS